VVRTSQWDDEDVEQNIKDNWDDEGSQPKPERSHKPKPKVPKAKKEKYTAPLVKQPAEPETFEQKRIRQKMVEDEDFENTQTLFGTIETKKSIPAQEPETIENQPSKTPELVPSETPELVELPPSKIPEPVKPPPKIPELEEKSYKIVIKPKPEAKKPSAPSDALPIGNISSDADRIEFATKLSNLVTRYSDSPHYPKLLKEIIKNITVPLSSDDMKELSKILNVAANDKQKQEKGPAKKTKAGAKKKSLNMKNDDFDDIPGGYTNQLDDDLDFM